MSKPCRNCGENIHGLTTIESATPYEGCLNCGHPDDVYTPNYYCPDCESGFGDSRTTCAYCGETLCIAPRIQYVNAYRVELAYGGPEEGGWWYNVQTPLASIPFDTHRDKDGSIEDSHTAYLKTLFPNPDNMTSVAGDAHDVAVYTEYHMARDKPDTVPHYE